MGYKGISNLPIDTIAQQSNVVARLGETVKAFQQVGIASQYNNTVAHLSETVKAFQQVSIASQYNNTVARLSETVKAFQQVGIASQYNNTVARLSETVKAFQQVSIASQYNNTVARLSETVKAFQQVGIASQYNNTVARLSETVKAFQQVGIASQYSNIVAHLSETLKAFEQGVNSQIEPLKNNFAGIANIDLSGIETLDISSLIDKVPISQYEAQQGNSDLPASITVETSTKLKDITVDEFENLLKKHTSESSKELGKKTLSIVALITFIFEEYTKEIALVLIEIVFAFTLTFLTGQLNAEVVAEVGERIEETNTVRDARKIITRYVKVNPTDQIAFLRKDTVLRASHSKTSPVVSKSPIDTKTVLTIIERKNNWVKVQVNTGNACGETGWVQKSAVIKFKKID